MANETGANSGRSSRRQVTARSSSRASANKQFSRSIQYSERAAVTETMNSASLSSYVSYASAISALLRSTAPTQGSGIILTTPTPPNVDAVRMELNLNSLLNDTLSKGGSPVQNASALPAALLRSQLIEAVVLRSTLLPA